MSLRSVLAIAAVVLAALGTRPVLAQNDNPLLYELLNRMDLLEREVRQLRGDLEVLQHRSGQGGNDQALEQRIEALEQRLGVAGTPPPAEPEPATTTANPPTGGSTLLPLPPRRPDQQLSPPPADARDVYEQGFAQVRDGRYSEGVETLRRFINVYPANSLTGDAYYWLGEAYYAMRNFDRAEEVLVNLGTEYPGNNKIPDALLKLGYIYSERGDTARARQVLEKLLDTYPDSVAASLGEMQLRELR